MRTYNSIIIYGKIATSDQIENKFPWLKNAEFENAKIKVLGISDPKLYWQGGTWKKGIFEGSSWDNGTFQSGEFNGKVWYNGIWVINHPSTPDPIWKSGKFKIGKLLDLEDNSYTTLSDITPWVKKSNFRIDIQPLKTNQFQTPKEIRQIKDPTLYSIADRLVRM